MAEYKDREHYIPLHECDLVDLLAGEKEVSAADQALFRQFAILIANVFHFEYRQKLDELKRDYTPFDPDAVEKRLRALTPQEKQELLAGFFQHFAWLMERANFTMLDDTAVHAATHAASEFGVPMAVDMGVFEKLACYARGDALGKRARRHWRHFWRIDHVEVPIYQRLAIIAKLRASKHLPRDINTDAVYLKIFKDIPKMDLAMLLPAARLRMPGFQQLKMGGSWIAGLGYVFYSIGTDLLEALASGTIWLFWGPLAAIFGYGYKQWASYQSTRTTYGLHLSQSLYYLNLDNNAGVLFHLLDEAEEQECREALLAYFFLWRYPREQGWTSSDLDDAIEEYLERTTGLQVDFEIGDALAKLKRLKLVARDGERWSAYPIARALEMLDFTWDNYFKYANPEPETPPIP